MAITKVPIIMTASNQKKVKNIFIQKLRESDILFESVRYKYQRSQGNIIRAFLKMIFLFENFVSEKLTSALPKMNDIDLRQIVTNYMSKNFASTSQQIEELYK